MAFYNSIDDGNNFVISFSQNPEQDFGIFAKGYTQAASILAEHVLEKSYFSDYEAYPIVFLYRQAFELYLKGLFIQADNIFTYKDLQKIECQFFYRHRLQPFAETFRKICTILFPLDQGMAQVSNLVYRYAVEFDQIDSESFGYRYPIDTKGNSSTKHHQVVNLQAFHTCMKDLLNKMSVVDFGFDIEVTKAQEILKIMKEAERNITLAKDKTY